MGKGTDIHYPEQPSYGESLRDSLQAQIDLAPALYQAEAESRPRYAQLETDILRDTLLGRDGERGMLDFMGAPAQQYAEIPTQDAQWDDPAMAQFERGYGENRALPYRPPWQQQQPPQSGGGLFGGPRVTLPPPWRKAGFGDGVDRSTFMGAEDNTGMMGAGGQGPQPTGVIGEGQNQRIRRSFPRAVAQEERRQELYDTEQMRQERQLAQAQARTSPTAEAPVTWRDVDAGRAVDAPQVNYRDMSSIGSRFNTMYPSGNVVDLLHAVQHGNLSPQQRAEATRKSEELMASKKPAVPIEGDGDIEHTFRAPGRVGSGRESDFGGLAQYGADIAEYGAGRQRAADIRDVGRYGQEVTRAIREADPLSSAILGRMSGIAGQELAGAGSGRYGPLLTGMRAEAGGELLQGATGRYGGLLGEMGVQAQEGLEAQGGLTARERRDAIQDARQAAEARGRSYDPLALVGELESLEGARRARRAEQRGFAGQTMAAQEARKAAARQYAANLMQMEAARRGEARQFAGGIMGQSRAMSADPFMAILGRPSGAGQQVAQQTFGGAQYGLSAGPGVAFNPEAGLSYMLGQQANQGNLAAAQAGASAQRQAGMMGMMGQIGAAAICWVAREVYGESNPKWKQFRTWMLSKAPTWFRDWYIRNGERVAEFIKDKPEIKARIKVFMDSKLEA